MKNIHRLKAGSILLSRDSSGNFFEWYIEKISNTYAYLRNVDFENSKIRPKVRLDTLENHDKWKSPKRFYVSEDHYEKVERSAVIQEEIVKRVRGGKMSLHKLERVLAEIKRL